MAQGDILVDWPLAGLDRGVGVQNQRPFSCADMSNVRARDPFEKRLTGGSRPGNTRAFIEELGVSNDRVIRLQHSLPTALPDGGYWKDDFIGSLQTVWNAASWADGVLRVSNNVGTGGATITAAYSQDNLLLANTRTPFPDLDTTKPYIIRIQTSPYNGKWGGTYELYALMDNVTPDGEEDGIRLSVNANRAFLSPQSGDDPDEYVWNIVLTKYVGGVASTVGSIDVPYSETGFQGFPIKLLIRQKSGDPTKVEFFVYLYNTLLTGLSGEMAYSATRHTIGLGLDHRTGVDGFNQFFADLIVCDWMDVSYTTSIQSALARRMLLVSAGQRFYYSTPAGGLTEHVNSSGAGALRIANDRRVIVDNRAGDAFIADNGAIKYSGNDGVITGTNTFSSATNATLTNVNAENDYLVVSGQGSFKITAVNTGPNPDTLTITAAGVVAPTNGTNLTFTIQKAPKVYKSRTNEYEVLRATAGAVPVGCKWVAAYYDCIVWGGNGSPDAFFSAQGDGYNYDYAARGGRRALVLSESDTGAIGDEPLAGIPSGNDYFIFLCRSQVWCLRGHPARGGTLDAVDRTVGIIGANAWCHGEEGVDYFLSQTGMFRITGGVQLKNISRGPLPAELTSVSIENYEVSLQYDAVARSIRVFLTSRIDADSRHYNFDLETGGFEPDDMVSELGPFATCSHVGDGCPEWTILLGGRDGYIRKPDYSTAMDDGNEVPSYVLLGPFKLGAPGFDGTIAKLVGTMASRSANTTWNIYVGDTPEEARAAASFASGTWKAGLNYPEYPRARGGFGFLKVSGNGTDHWGYTKTLMTIEQGGMLRKA